jgi:peptidoglycan biosynthesis protein MviN/MurJ (putative lipid II flippase)
MGYAIAWVIYLVMAVLLQIGFERYLTPYLLAQRQLRIFLRSLLAILLFTPGVVLNADGVFIVPACVGVMFNILAKSPYGLLQAALPLLLVSAVVYGILFALERRRGPEAAA